MKRNRVFLSGNFYFIIFWLFVMFMGFSPSSFAQIEMKQTGTYIQNFNSLSSTGGANEWVDNQTIPGWYWKCDFPSNPATYYSDDGSSEYNGKRCYGPTGDVDRAIGGLPGNGVGAFTYGAKFYNSSSKTITNFSVGFTGEQWRIGYDINQEQIKFYYKITTDPLVSISTAPISTDGWIGVTNLNFISPKTGTSRINLNGNDAANRVIKADYTISGISISPASYILILWYDQPNNSFGDHGLAIDDVTVKWTVPSDGTSTSNIWTGALSTDWFDIHNWSKAVVPGVDSDVEIASTTNKAVCNENVSIKNLKIASGGQLTINSGKTITVEENAEFGSQNCLILKSPTTLINSSNDHAATASFHCKGTISGQGGIKVERFVTGYLSDTDGWHFFSSPVNHPSIEGPFLPGASDDLYEYYEIGDEWLNQKVVANDINYFVNGLGYLISYSSNILQSISGQPNNSDIKLNNLSYTGNRGWHLLGNPFPCGISWGGTEWGISNVSSVAKLLNSGGTYTDVSVGEIIPAMNGFFVKANGEVNSITIPKTARLHSISEGWKDSKLSSGKNLKLTVKSNTDNTYAESKIKLNELATTGYDSMYDSPYLSGMDGTPLFYSVLSNGQELSTNNVPDQSSLIFNFEFTSGIAKAYTLKAEISDDWIKTSTFILEDKLTNIKHTLTNGSSFTFNSSTTDSPGRFRLIVDIITGIADVGKEENLQIITNNRKVEISIPGNIKSGLIHVYDLSGKQIYSAEIVKEKIDFKVLNSGIYLVHLFFNNRQVTRKIFVL